MNGLPAGLARDINDQPIWETLANGDVIIAGDTTDATGLPLRVHVYIPRADLTTISHASNSAAAEWALNGGTP